jgi:hypothetical protein
MIVQHLRAAMRASGDNRQDQPMKILFYLPIVTPWWFENLIAPMLRALNGEAELHVMVAPLWRDTGLDIAHIEPLADLTAIKWHIVVPDDPLQFRVDGAAVDGVSALLAAIDPDLTLARCGDASALADCPGIVRYITEPGANPYHAPHRWFVLGDRPFQHGAMPDHLAAAADHAAMLIEPTRQAIMSAYGGADRNASRARLGLPVDRPILAVPLQYEHIENFFGAGSPLQNGPRFLAELLAGLDEQIMLAVTDHPLNIRHLSRGTLKEMVAKFPGRIRIFPVIEGIGSPSSLTIHAADAVLIDRSKSLALAAFFGTPIVNVGDLPIAEWMNAAALTDVTAQRIANRGLPGPDPVMARRWFGWHFGMRLVDSNNASLEKLMNRAMHRAEESEVTDLIAFLQPWLGRAEKAAMNIVAQDFRPSLSGPLAA